MGFNLSRQRESPQQVLRHLMYREVVNEYPDNTEMLVFMKLVSHVCCALV